MTRTLSVALAAWLVGSAFGTGAAAAAQDTLERAKELYGSAAYDEALGVLDRLSTDSSGPEATEIALYRMFCLLVLERNDDASEVIEQMVRADPFYLPSDDLASPRVRTFFEQARRRLLPGVAEAMYADARAAFNKKDPAAAGRFETVLKLLDDPSLINVPAFADLRTLATEFRDLSRATASAAADRAVADERLAAAAKASAAPPPAARPATPPVAVEGEKGVTPPVVVSQTLPPWLPQGRDAEQSFSGFLEVLIDEQGRVSSAKLRQPVHPRYDPVVVKQALTWRYRPATRNGAPTRFLKVVQIRLQPPG